MAARAGTSQDSVSRIERGQLEALQVRTLRRVCRALEIELSFGPQWRGGDVDRLADEDHARLVARVARLLVELGWVVEPEVSFSVFGERGSIDLLAWHPATRVLLVIEVKSSLNSVEETLRRHDVKVRLGSTIASERLGWTPVAVRRLLVLPETTTARRRVAAHDSVLSRAYPRRGREMLNWLRHPTGVGGGLMFLSLTLPGRGRRVAGMRRRVRMRSRSATDASGA